ncbi:MAG: GIY-YIG nuclease family protein [Rhodospirillaceae bacterium]
MKQAWVFMVTNRPNSVLYVGITNDISRRAWEHREGIGGQFTSKYRLKTLVYAEHHEIIVEAIRREKQIKHWPRQYKINLNEASNPEWRDLTREFLW